MPFARFMNKRLFTPTPLQKATAVKPRMNAGILLAKRETDKATPVKVWGFTVAMLMLCGCFIIQTPCSVRAFPAESLNNTMQDFFQQGAQAYARGNNTEAIASFEKVLAQDPHHETARGLLIIALGEEAMIKYQDGNYDAALPQLNKLLQLMPDDNELQNIYLQVRASQKSTQEGVALVDATRTVQKQYENDWKEYGLLGSNSENIIERIGYLEKMYMTYAGTMVNIENLEKAMNDITIERQRMIKHMTPQERFAEGLALYQRGRYHDAIDIWKNIEKEYTGQNVAYYIAQTEAMLNNTIQTLLDEAGQLKMEDQWDKALSNFKKALMLNPKNNTARNGIKEIYTGLTQLFNNGVNEYQSNNYQGAITYWEKVHMLYPGFRGVDQYIRHMHALIQKEQLTAQETLINAYIQNGDALHKQGRFFAAVELWKKVLSIDPQNDKAQNRIRSLLETLYKMADKNYRARNIDHALEIWQLIVSIDSRYRDVKQRIATRVTEPVVNTAAQVQQGEQAFYAGNYAQAFNVLQKALQSDPRNQKALQLAVESALAQGIIYYRSDKLTEAIQFWNFVLRYQPNHEKATKYKQRAELKKEMLKKIQK